MYFIVKVKALSVQIRKKGGDVPSHAVRLGLPSRSAYQCESRYIYNEYVNESWKSYIRTLFLPRQREVAEYPFESGGTLQEWDGVPFAPSSVAASGPLAARFARRFHGLPPEIHPGALQQFGSVHGPDSLRDSGSPKTDTEA